MRYGPEILVLEGTAVRAAIFNDSINYRLRSGGRVEVGGGTYIPDAPMAAAFGAWRMEFDGEELWVLTGGALGGDGPEEPNDQLVTYSLDGRKLGVRQLPLDAMDFAVTQNIVYILASRADQPTLLALRRR